MNIKPYFIPTRRNETKMEDKENERCQKRKMAKMEKKKKWKMTKL